MNFEVNNHIRLSGPEFYETRINNFLKNKFKI